MLRLQRESSLDPQHERRGGVGRVGIAFAGPRRPLQLDRPHMTRDGFADDLRPIGDEACLAETPRGERSLDDLGQQFGERLGAAARPLHHRSNIRS